MVSIIVPVYNKEKYLEQCINSALNQTYMDFELLLVDDSSTDNSYFICKKYQKLDNRIICKQITHGGVSKARNEGLELSTGEYIVFLDADDMLYRNALEILVTGITSSNTDIFLSEINVRLLKSYNTYTQFILQRRRCSVWGHIYKREILEDIRFKEDLFNNEDIIFLYDVSMKTNNIAGTSTKIYRYNRDAKDSLCKSSSITKLNSTLMACDIIASNHKKSLEPDFIVFKFYMYVYILLNLELVHQKEKILVSKKVIIQFLRKNFFYWMKNAKEKNRSDIIKFSLLILIPNIVTRVVRIVKG